MTENNDHNDSSFPRSRVKKQSNKVLYLFIITILALTGGFFFYQKNIVSIQQGYLDDNTTPMGEDNSSYLEGSSLESSGANSTNQLQQPQELNVPTELISNNIGQTNPAALSENTTNTGQERFASAQNNSTELSETAVAESNDAAAQDLTTAKYAKSLRELNDFYTHLDAAAYMQAFELAEPSKDHFSKLIQKLLDNPPVVTRETDDLFTLLKNTAHFFRIIGKDNILVLKGILDREKESIEVVLESLYQLTERPQLLEDEYSLRLDPNALYDYAGFFLNTMGGRLYLFRRDSNSRMAVSFYAIKIIDRANQSGDSRHGIDIRPAVDSLIEEIENGGNNLKNREYYLDTLYDLKVKYS